MDAAAGMSSLFGTVKFESKQKKKKKNWHGFKIFGVKIINWRIMNFRSVSLFAGVFDNNLTNQSSHLYSSLLGIPTSDRNNDI